MQEIVTIAARRIRIHTRQPHRLTVRKRGDRAHLGNNRRHRVAHGFLVRRIHDFRTENMDVDAKLSAAERNDLYASMADEAFDEEENN